MTTTFAIDVIQTFQPSEVVDFKAFLDSPYCSKGYNAEAVKPFFEVLYESIQNGEIEKTKKEDLHQHIFRGKLFIESKIDKLMSDLKRLLERFLLTQRYFSEQNEGQQLLDLSTEMRLRGLESRYIQALEKTKKHINTPGEESLKSLFFRYMLAMEHQEWHSTFNRVKGDLNIPETVNYLDIYYFAHKTWMLNHLMFMRKATSPADSEEGLNEIVWEVPQKTSESSVFLSICWEVYLLLKKKVFQIEDFDRLLKKIQSNEMLLSAESLSEFYAYLRNLCVMLVNEGHSHFYSILHEINKSNLERGYFYLEGKISPNACLSIMQAALIVGANNWALAFIEAHKDNIIGENETHDFYRMNKALYFFGEKKYDEAIDIIPFGSTYSFYHLMARRLELKIYYELRSELLDHKIDAFKMFISRAGRKVLSQSLHESFTNFVNFVRQLSQSNGTQDKQRSQTLIKRINEKKLVGEKLWLLEKAKELGEKR